MSAAYFNQYLTTQVNSASPEELLLMLYNGAIRFLKEAEEAMREGRVAQQGMCISRTIAILNELSATLDHRIGGEISENLERLYTYMCNELLQANIHDDSQRLAGVITMLSGLRDTWVKAVEQVRSQQLAGKDNGYQQAKSAVL